MSVEVKGAIGKSGLKKSSKDSLTWSKAASRASSKSRVNE
jgi:hypothetical protein